MPIAYLLLGSNEGERIATIQQAIDTIALLPNTNVIQISKWYETEAWGITTLPPHVNVALAIDTQLNPQVLLQQLLDIETNLGRLRQIKWGQRTIDIDIIFYDDRIINESNLQIPHPLMQLRKFVLQPLNDLIPQFIHPILQITIENLLENCPDKLKVVAIN